MPRLLVGDVTRLTELGLGGGFSLLLDLGCLHSIPDAGRDGYVRGATELAGAGATFLLFCFVRGEKQSRIGPRGVAAGEVRQRFADDWDIVSEVKGGPMFGADATWYRLRRR